MVSGEQSWQPVGQETGPEPEVNGLWESMEDGWALSVHSSVNLLVGSSSFEAKYSLRPS